MDRNMILAIALSLAVLIGWQVFVITPQQEALKAAREAQAVEEALKPENDISGVNDFIREKIITVEEALASTPHRVSIKTPNLIGSINLKGGRIDDLSLVEY